MIQLSVKIRKKQRGTKGELIITFMEFKNSFNPSLHPNSLPGPLSCHKREGIGRLCVVIPLYLDFCEMQKEKRRGELGMKINAAISRANR